MKTATALPANLKCWKKAIDLVSITNIYSIKDIYTAMMAICNKIKPITQSHNHTITAIPVKERGRSVWSSPSLYPRLQKCLLTFNDPARIYHGIVTVINFYDIIGRRHLGQINGIVALLHYTTIYQGTATVEHL
jgi:hypothetical protein